MITKLGRLAAIALTFGAASLATTASAFESAVDYPYTYGITDVPAGGIMDHCPGNWEAYFSDPRNADTSGGTTYDVSIKFNAGSAGSVYAEGGEWLFGSYQSRKRFTAQFIDDHCANLSNITNLTEDGIKAYAGQTVGQPTGVAAAFAAETYVGVSFEANYTDGNRYRYELAFSGDTNTQFINTKTQIAANNPPVASAGANQTVAPGALVTLDGLASTDADNDPLHYTWSQTSGPTVELSSTTVAGPTFTAPALDGQTLVFTLTVDDGQATSAGSSVVITTSETMNTAPLANAGPDQTVPQGTLVTLTGAASSDADGQPLTYKWTQVGENTVTLSDVNAESPTFTAPTLVAADDPLVLTFSLQVNDGFDDSPLATVMITVTPPPDTTAPVIAQPADIITTTDGTADTASITLNAQVTDDVDTGIVPVFSIGATPIPNTYAFPVGTTTVSVGAQDGAGNPAVTVTFDVTVTDTTPPTDPSTLDYTILAGNAVEVTGTADANSTVTVTFPDASTVTVPATGGTFTATSATGMISGDVTVVARDAADNASAAVTLAIVLDNTAPQVTITGVPETFTGTTPFVASFVLSEDVIGFEIGDITVSGATLSGFAGTDAANYSVTVTPSGSGDVVLSVAADVAQDAAGNANLASDVATATNQLAEMTATMLANEAQARARNLAANQPNLASFMLGRQGQLQLNATRQGGVARFATADRPVWASINGNWSDTDAGDSSYVLAITGAHFYRTEDLILGGMAQFDQSTTEDGDASIDATGWLIGGYFVSRPFAQPFYLSGSYLAGQSDITVSPLGSFSDSFTSDRSLLTLNATGQIDLDWLVLMPSLDLSRVTEDQPGYTDSLSNPMPAQAIVVTEAALGLDFTMPITVSNGTMDLFGGLSAIQSSTEVSGVIDESQRGRIDLGMAYETETGISLRLNTYRDGLGNDAYDSFGAEALVAFTF